MPKKTRIVVSVILDLVTDQRVHKVCNSLQMAGYDVLVIGGKRKKSLPLTPRGYKAVRLSLLFQKKMWFYAEYNFKLFFKLLFTKCDILLANDLDVLPANYLAARIKRKPLVYDTHEYFLGMPQLNGKRLAKKVWTMVERSIFPNLKYIYTICQSFCELYYKDYGKKLWYIRNVPPLQIEQTFQFEKLKKEIDSTIPRDKHILLYQGAGINHERGAEELILSTKFLDPTKFHLLLVGGGDVFDTLVRMIHTKGLSDRITIIPKVPFEVLRHITRQAHLGLTLDKPNNINHLYGLPNKIFDYLHSGVPVLSSRLVEMERIISTYEVGTYINNHEPEHIAQTIIKVFSNPAELEKWKQNTEKVKAELNWENEEKVLLQIFEKVSADTNLPIPRQA
jgi:glycosyltransferase involved in cell wall biosynthesis